MSDEEWAFFERFILAVRAPNGRKPTSHRVVLDGIFLDRSHWCPMAGPARRVRQMVERLPAVSALDIGGSLGGHHGRPKPERGSAGCPSNDRQHCSSGPSSGSKRKKGTPRQGFGRSRGGFTTKIHLRVDHSLYSLRNLVERCFNKLKNARRVATRYDKTAESFLGFIDITSIHLWLRLLST